MGKIQSNLIEGLQERLEFFSEIGLDFIHESKQTPLQQTGKIIERTPLKQIEIEIIGCRACPLARSRKNAVPGEGNIKADLMFVGEGPGSDEDAQGKPFVGKAGQLLTKIITAMNYQREDVYITNLVKCRPPDNRNPNSEEIKQCRHFLRRQIELINPKIIVSLGNVPTQFFLATKTGITSLRGKFYDHDNVKIMPTFHPSYLVRQESNRALRKAVWEDMQQVMDFLGRR